MVSQLDLKSSASEFGSFIELLDFKSSVCSEASRSPFFLPNRAPKRSLCDSALRESLAYPWQTPPWRPTRRRVRRTVQGAGDDGPPWPWPPQAPWHGPTVRAWRLVDAT